MLLREPVQIAGVDGCKGGRWVSVTASVEDFGEAEVEIFQSAASLIAETAPRSIIAIDVPIGLPELATNGGREADREARKFLGRRGVSVFPVPSRRAVFAHARRAQDYKLVCTVARKTSNPRKAISRQLFAILDRIQEIDLILHQDPVLWRRVFEVHPEVSFQVMNYNQPLPPKKVEGRISLPGMEFRKKLLIKAGFSPSFLSQKPPRGAALDDFYDACACARSAKRILLGTARVFPSHPLMDAEGLEQAIRA
jgi:predicted RNase H-like nuclease